MTTHPGKLEMGMRVDEAGENGNVAEVDDFDIAVQAGAGVILSGAGNLDAAAVHQHPAIAHGLRCDREDPPRAIEDQWPVSRAFFSAALRAA